MSKMVRVTEAQFSDFERRLGALQPKARDMFSGAMIVARYADQIRAKLHLGASAAEVTAEINKAFSLEISPATLSSYLRKSERENARIANHQGSKKAQDQKSPKDALWRLDANDDAAQDKPSGEFQLNSTPAPGRSNQRPTPSLDCASI